MSAHSLRGGPISKRGELYAKLAGYSETVLVRDTREPNLVYVVHDPKQERPKETLQVPQDRTEIIGWFAGHDVVRVR